MYLRRLPDRMTAYWEQLRKGIPLPDYGSFRSDAIMDLWSHCFSLSVLPAGDVTSFIYDYVGSDVMEAYGENVAGRLVSSRARGGPGDNIIAKLENVMKSKEPLIEGGVFVNGKGRAVKYRACILPFGREKVTNMVVGVAWQAT